MKQTLLYKYGKWWLGLVLLAVFPITGFILMFFNTFVSPIIGIGFIILNSILVYEVIKGSLGRILLLVPIFLIGVLFLGYPVLYKQNHDFINLLTQQQEAYKQLVPEYNPELQNLYMAHYTAIPEYKLTKFFKDFEVKQVYYRTWNTKPPGNYREYEVMVFVNNEVCRRVKSDLIDKIDYISIYKEEIKGCYVELYSEPQNSIYTINRTPAINHKYLNNMLVSTSRFGSESVELNEKKFTVMYHYIKKLPLIPIPMFGCGTNLKNTSGWVCKIGVINGGYDYYPNMTNLGTKYDGFYGLELYGLRKNNTRIPLESSYEEVLELIKYPSK